MWLAAQPPDPMWVGTCLPIVSCLQNLDQLYVLVSSNHKIPARAQVGKLVVACCWLAVYSVESDIKPQLNKQNK